MAKQALPISFEMFPAASPQGRSRLAKAVDKLGDLATGGFSVTMGAGGSSNRGTLETAKEISKKTGKPVKAHLIALGHSREDALAEADRFWNAGITRLVALRGDPPRLADGREAESFRYASELVAALGARHEFEISVAAYPEKHPEAASLEEDIDNLKRKLDAGASKAICQFVLNPEAYARFVDVCAKRGVTAPIIPGLIPIENWTKVRGFAEANGTAIPEALDRRYAHLEPGSDACLSLAKELLLQHALKLLSYGAPALHVYALNKWELPLALAHELNGRINDSVTGMSNI